VLNFGLQHCDSVAVPAGEPKNVAGRAAWIQFAKIFIPGCNFEPTRRLLHRFCGGNNS